MAMLTIKEIMGFLRVFVSVDNSSYEDVPSQQKKKNQVVGKSFLFPIFPAVGLLGSSMAMFNSHSRGFAYNL